MASKKNKHSTVQAVVFSSNWTAKNARKWLKKNNFKAIKRVHKTSGGFLRYRIVDPNKRKADGSLKFERFFWKKTSKGINFIIGIS